MWPVRIRNRPPDRLREPETAHRGLAGNGHSHGHHRLSHPCAGHQHELWRITQAHFGQTGLTEKDSPVHQGAILTVTNVSAPINGKGWFKSSYSSASASCVEIKFAVDTI